MVLYALHYSQLFCLFTAILALSLAILYQILTFNLSIPIRINSEQQIIQQEVRGLNEGLYGEVASNCWKLFNVKLTSF